MLWEEIDLTDWRKKKSIVRELKMSYLFEKKENLDRRFRKSVEEQNKLYQKHESEIFIAHSNQGYKIAENEAEIKASLRDTLKRGINQIIKYHKGLQAMGENANMKIEFKGDSMMIVGEL